MGKKLSEMLALLEKEKEEMEGETEEHEESETPEEEHEEDETPEEEEEEHEDDGLEEGNDEENEQLEMGLKVEKEHAGLYKTLKKFIGDEMTAEEFFGAIAMAHIKEDPKYYTKLNKAGL